MFLHPNGKPLMFFKGLFTTIKKVPDEKKTYWDRNHPIIHYNFTVVGYCSPWKF